MKIAPQLNNDYIGEQYSRNVDRPANDAFQPRFPDPKQEASTPQPRSDASTRRVLSPQEQTTLHMLFGSEKPEDLNFYSKNKVSLINRGQLLDVRG